MIYTLGIDEVGRGAMAVPVYLAGLILGSDFPRYCHHFNPSGFDHCMDLKMVRDSKRLSIRNRCKIDLLIGKKYQFRHFTFCADATLIDQWGIGVCLSHLVWLMIWQTSVTVSDPYEIVIDGKIKTDIQLSLLLLIILCKQNCLDLDIIPKNSNICSISTFNLAQIEQNPNVSAAKGNYSFTPSLPQNVTCIIRENQADDRYLSVACASIIAKVARDRFMDQISVQFPGFGWDKNKGYGTPLYLAAIAQNPHNPLLRQTFLTKFLSSNNLSR